MQQEGKVSRLTCRNVNKIIGPRMSSTTAATVAADDGVTATSVERHTYWCHVCDMSVSLLFSAAATSFLRCPHCHSEFLEELDSPLFNPNSNPILSHNPNSNFILSHIPNSNSILSHNPNSNPSSGSPFVPPLTALSPYHYLIPSTDEDVDITEATDFQLPFAAASDDNFLLDSPYLHRLIQHLSNSDSDGLFPATTARHQSAASKSAVESIPTIKITAALLDADPINLCAVCKDQFSIDTEVKQLPCNHLYHPDCILPWLESHNSCPVCRYELPTEIKGDDSRERRSRFAAAVRFGELMMEDDELFGFGSTLRHIARRHRMVLPVVGRHSGGMEASESFSPTQIAEAEIDVPARANSVETVSSWPVEGSVAVGAGGSGSGDVGVIARMSDEGDTLMS